MSLVKTLRFIVGHPLNSGSPLKALMRFARWQIVSRLFDGDFVFSWINGARYKVRRGQTGLTGNIYTGLHEFEDMAFLLHYLRPNDLFLDVGANVGSYTVLASSAVGASCIAIEPVPSAYKCLVENVRLNGKEATVECMNIAVGDKEGIVRFTSDVDTINHVVAHGEVAGATVEVMIEEIDKAIAPRLPRLVKIDVEGYETPAISGATQTLSGTAPCAVIMELNGSGERYGYDEVQILQRMLEWGYKPYKYEPLSRTLSELPTKNSVAGNTVFIRGEAFARERIESAPRYLIFGQHI